MIEKNRNWLNCRFFHTNNLEEPFIELAVLVIPGYLDFIKFSRNVSEATFQVVAQPIHAIGRSEKDRNYHYISLEIREVIVENKNETSTHVPEAKE